MSPAINSGAYFAPGTDVIVADDAGPFLGRILNIGERAHAEAVVAVIDPRDNEDRHVGQRIICSWRQLHLAPPDDARTRLWTRLHRERHGDGSRS